MAFLEFKNVRIAGFSSCVPKNIEDNMNYPYFEEGEAEKFISTTSVRRKRVAEDGVCTSDLCLHAAEKMISDLGWDKSEVECLIFVTQTPDYIIPATSCILQERLGLSKDCYALDISLGCSGWVYGLSTIASLLASGGMKKGLLLAGEIAHAQSCVLDKSAYPLFGDAGTVTALEFQENAESLKFHFSTDGGGYNAIIIEDGGYRNPVTSSSFEVYTTSEGLKRTRLCTKMDGWNVFSFGISRAPESFNFLMNHFVLDKEKIDFYIMHQANFFMNNMIRKKLKIDKEKVPYSMQDFGNTSSASIPLTIITQCSDNLVNKGGVIVACGFGVGLSWGTVHFVLDERVVLSDLVEI